MEALKNRLEEIISEDLVQVVISNPKKGVESKKVKIRPFMDKNTLCFQESNFIGTKVFHTNRDKKDTIAAILTYMEQSFKQMEIETRTTRDTVLISKAGKITRKTQKHGKVACESVDLSHNRKKKYIIDEHTVVPFLVQLGVQTKEGKIVNSKYDKFRQINRYLEFIDDVYPLLAKEDTIEIIDFGCGKAYLTFAMYYYLVFLKKQKVHIVGLDLKEDVVAYCNKLKDEFGYNDLSFEMGSIEKYQTDHKVDMVVTLHACDTATDFALAKAVQWQAKVILSVPCCQHELNGQISNEMLQPIFKYGIIKERISALMTDAIRANILEENGYDTQILEFIDMEHTPKNLLIRAVKKQQGKENLDTGVEKTISELHVDPTIKRLL